MLAVRHLHHALAIVALTTFASAAAAWAAPSVRCDPDAVAVGLTCVDKYEASVWSIPANAEKLVRKVQRGRATRDELVAAGAVQIGGAGEGSCDPAPYAAAGFPQNGNWTRPLYAVSVPGVLPSVCVSWFQAANACRLSGKRLLTNEEWQVAASGTPDSGSDDQETQCNVGGAVGPTPTGARSACVSSWGAYDMIGNMDEWVAEWVPKSLPNNCPGWGGFSDDFMCLAGADPDATEPGALFRGGLWFNGPQAGVFGIGGHVGPTTQVRDFGFRCGR